MTIRRIKESDCKRDFRTGDRRFDKNREGQQLGIVFYYERDQTGKYETYVLVDHSQIVGILCIQKQQDNLYLSRLGIKEGQTDKGHGTQLLLFTLEKTKEYNKKKITCKAPEDAWSFYERVGFTKLSEYDDPHWGRSAFMELKLVLTRR